MGSISLGAFDLLELMDEGGTAQVWRGVHRARGLPVAVKIILSGQARDAAFQLMFYNEVRAVAGLEHPNIVCLYDYGEVSLEAQLESGQRLPAGSPYLVMELADQGTLGRQRAPMPWPALKATLLALLDALAHAHARGVIHLDLKPDNVLRFSSQGGEPDLKLTDFGIAYALDWHRTRRPGRDWQAEAGERDRRDAVIGTPLYMAPEQFIADWQAYGPWTDLYALGWIALQLASGHHPLSGLDLLQLAQAQRVEPPPPLETPLPVAPGFDAWVRRLLEKKPSARFQRACEAARELEQLPDRWMWAVQRPDAPPRPAAAPPRPADLPTVILDAASRPELADASSRAGGAVGREPGAGRVADRPAFPPTWREHTRRRRPGSLGTAGLNLYGLRSIPLVGRELERDVIWDALREAWETGHPRAVLVGGPAGTGKSRLVEWIAERAHEIAGATILKALHSPGIDVGAGLVPMIARHLRCAGQPRQDILERTRRVLEDLGVIDAYEWEALTELLASMAEETLEPGGSWQTAQTRRMVYLATPAERYVVVRRLLERLAAERPVIVWLDDVQWGSDALGFAAHLLQARGASPGPILLLLTAQDEALAERPLEAAQLEQVMAQACALRLPLPPLSHAHQLTLVGELLGLEAGLAEQVVARTGGHPLFAVQLVGDWVQRGVLELGPSGFVLKPGEGAVLPDDLHQVWLTRLTRALEGLDADALLAVELAAVLGQSVDPGEWRQACLEEAIRVPDALLDRLLAARLVRLVDQPGGSTAGAAWVFVHGMLRESLERAGREAGRLEAHHLACAEMLRRSYPIRQRLAAERLAGHLLAARCWEESLEPLLIAASARRDAAEHDLAGRLVDEREAVLRILERPESDSRWGDGWLLRAQLDLDLGRVDAAVQGALRMEEYAQRYGWSRLLPHGLELRGFAALRKGDLAVAEGLCRWALTLFEEAGDLAGVARCLSRGVGQHALIRGDLKAATRLYRQALALNRRRGDLHLESYCLLNLGLIAARRRQPARADVLIHGAVRLSERTGNQIALADGMRILGHIALSRRDSGRAIELIERARVLYERKEVSLGIGISLSDLGSVLRTEGRLDEAETCYRQALTWLGEAGGSHVIQMRLELGLVQLARRRFMDARQELEACRAALAQTDRRYYLGVCHGALLSCAAAARDEAAWALHLQAASVVLEMPEMLEPDAAWPVELAGELALRGGARARALEAYTLARRLWSILNQKEKTAQLDRILATLR